MDAENCRHPSCLQYSILSTLQCSLQCSLRTACSICTVVSTMRYNSVDNTLYIESLLTTTFSLPHSYHFLTTFTFSSLSLSRYCSSRVPTFSSLACSDFFKCYSDFSRLFAVSVVLATLHFEKAKKVTILSKQLSQVTICIEKLRFWSRDGSF